MSSKWTIFLESNTKNGERSGLRDETKNLCTPFFPKANSLPFLGLQGIPSLLDHFINCLTSASDPSDVSYPGDIILESSPYLANIYSSKGATSRSLRKVLNKCGPLTLPSVKPLFTTFHSLTNPLLLSLSLSIRPS